MGVLVDSSTSSRGLLRSKSSPTQKVRLRQPSRIRSLVVHPRPALNVTDSATHECPKRSAVARAVCDWPAQTFVGSKMQLSFNGEPVEILHQPAAHADGDSFVFRHSDVNVAGDIFLTTTYPFIDLERGGSIQGEIDALNTLVETMVPLHEEEGGTYVIPGHGRIVDRFEVVEYRDRVTIIRDRIRAAIKKGMTLDQVKAASLTPDYDYRYGSKTGPGTTDQFVELIYKSLTKKN